MTAVETHLNRDGADKLQNATRELLVTFALAETGKKLSKRLSDQRVYMKDTFDRHKDDDDARAAYLRHLSNTATFMGSTWDPVFGSSRQLAGLPAAAMTDTVKLCLAFLKDLSHSVAIAPLVRFYSEALNADEGEERDKRIAEFETAIKARGAARGRGRRRHRRR